MQHQSSPLRPEFRQLAQEYSLIAVSREVLVDLDTPVTAFWKLRRGPYSFLLESVEGGEKWARYTFMGTEPRAVYLARGTDLVRRDLDTGDESAIATGDPFATVTERLTGERFYADPALPRFVGGLVGSLSYDAVRWMERLPADNPVETEPPDLCFLETRLTLVWDNLKHHAFLVYLARVADPADAEAAYDAAEAALDEASARLAMRLPAMPDAPPPAAPDTTVSCSDADFCSQVEQAREYIAAGDVIQVVVSRRFTQPANGLHPYLVYRALRGVNPSPYMFYLELGPTTIVGASPEALVRLTDGLVETRPIAGTRPRGATEAHDRQYEEDLKADPKELAEHVMLVDLARNDVGRVARIGTVEVNERFVVERYSHVMHLVSHVRAQCRPELGPADVVRATFPAGTLSGAPKIRAMEIIEELEPMRRGIYGGAIGVVGADGNTDLCIAIRTLVARDDTFSVQAGAGLVYDSVPQTEAEETRNKARGMLRAIELARELFGAPGETSGGGAA